MARIETILCPVDFIPASARAVEYATELAREYEAELILLNVVSPIPFVANEMASDAAETIKAMTEASRMSLRRLAKSADSKGIRLQRIVRIGEVDAEIRVIAEDHKADLIVMGTRERHGVGQWLPGSIAERLMHNLPVPLLTVRYADAAGISPVFIRRILVTTDFSDASADAIEHALSIAREFRAKVTLLHVFNGVDVDFIRKELYSLIPAEARTWCDVRIKTGVPHVQILEALRTEKADLLVMNVHGKGFLDRNLMGSTAERVVRGATIPVLLIPMTAASKRNQEAA